MIWAGLEFVPYLMNLNLAITNHKSYLISNTMSILLVSSSKNSTISMICVLAHNRKMAPATVQLISAKCSQRKLTYIKDIYSKALRNLTQGERLMVPNLIHVGKKWPVDVMCHLWTWKLWELLGHSWKTQPSSPAMSLHMKVRSV